jgi:hypothetical protein
LGPLGMIKYFPCSEGGHDLGNPIRVDNMAVSHYPWSLAVAFRDFVRLLYGLFKRPRLWRLEILIRGRYAFSKPNQDSWGLGVNAWYFAIIGDRSGPIRNAEIADRILCEAIEAFAEGVVVKLLPHARSHCGGSFFVKVTCSFFAKVSCSFFAEVTCISLSWISPLPRQCPTLVARTIRKIGNGLVPGNGPEEGFDGLFHKGHLADIATPVVDVGCGPRSGQKSSLGNNLPCHSSCVYIRLIDDTEPASRLWARHGLISQIALPNASRNGARLSIIR